jgi:hypothetical protein
MIFDVTVSFVDGDGKPHDQESQEEGAGALQAIAKTAERRSSAWREFSALQVPVTVSAQLTDPQPEESADPDDATLEAMAESLQAMSTREYLVTVSTRDGRHQEYVDATSGVQAIAKLEDKLLQEHPTWAPIGERHVAATVKPPS